MFTFSMVVLVIITTAIFLAVRTVTREIMHLKYANKSDHKKIEEALEASQNSYESLEAHVIDLKKNLMPNAPELKTRKKKS